MKLNRTAGKYSGLFWMVLAVAAFLRLSGLTFFSLSNDELSALSRLQFDSFNDLIKFGVYPDFHPAGVQVFLFYWTHLFGNSEWMVRFPFALLGIGSVFLIYEIGKKWFSESAGILAAAALAVLEFPLIYSQIARPYSPGLFFSLAAVYFWSTVFINRDAQKSVDKKNRLHLAGFAISVSACMYIHYFSFIMAGIICLAGLFFLNRRLLIPYLLTGVAIVVLYLPHLDIFMAQLAKGGVGGAEGWLGPPKSDAFRKYIEFIFNDSKQLLLIFFIMLCGTILIYRKEIRFNRMRITAVIFFIVPFAVAYFYSLYRNPVYQHSVLLFSFPFLLLFIFSFIPQGPVNFTTRFLAIVTLVAGYQSTVVENKYYSKAHFSEFRDIAKTIVDLNKSYGAEHITTAVNVFSPYYLKYYTEKFDFDATFAISSVMSNKEVRDFNDIVTNSKTQFFIFAFSNTYDDPALDLLIRTRYPFIIQSKNYLNSGIRCYSTSPSDTIQNRTPLAVMNYGFENLEWEKENIYRDSLVRFDGTYSVKVDTASEFGPGIFKPKGFYKLEKGSEIEMSVKLYSTQPDCHAKLVISIEQGGKSLIWNAADANRFITGANEWFTMVVPVTIEQDLPDDAVVKIYLWNEKHESYNADDFKLSIYSSR